MVGLDRGWDVGAHAPGLMAMEPDEEATTDTGIYGLEWNENNEDDVNGRVCLLSSQ